MDEDILDRLRNHLGKNLAGHLPCVRCTAADQIESLRTERDGWKARALELDALYVKEHGHG